MGNTQIINWDPIRISTKNGYLTHPSFSRSKIKGTDDKLHS